MNTNPTKDKKPLSTEELEAVAGGAISQPHNESAQPNPDPLPAAGTTLLTVDELGLSDLPELPAEV